MLCGHLLPNVGFLLDIPRKRGGSHHSELFICSQLMLRMTNGGEPPHKINVAVRITVSCLSLEIERFKIRTLPKEINMCKVGTSNVRCGSGKIVSGATCWKFA